MGSEPGHLRRTRGFPGTNSRVWEWRERDLAWERMKSAASRYWGLGWAVLIRRYCWNLDMADDGDNSEYSSASDDFEDESSGEKEVIIAVIMKKRWRRFIKFLLLDSM